MDEIIKTLKAADKEGTRAPYWVIIDPIQNMSCNIHAAASQITGIFFCRKDAKDYLKGKRYNYSARAKVYCLSGHHSIKYEELFTNKEG